MKFALYWWTIIVIFAILFIAFDIWETIHRRPSIIFDGEDDYIMGLRISTFIPLIVLGLYILLVLSYIFVKEQAQKNKWKKVL